MHVPYLLSGAVNLTREEFTSRKAAAVVGDVGCTGTENYLTDCSYRFRPGCGELDDAGVVCQGKELRRPLLID